MFCKNYFNMKQFFLVAFQKKNKCHATFVWCESELLLVLERINMAATAHTRFILRVENKSSLKLQSGH